MKKDFSSETEKMTAGCTSGELMTLTKAQARMFMLLKHGLIGKKKFKGKQGVLEFVDQVGCIQFDPIDVCGRNADLVLQSRVEGYTKNMLYDLLYEDRKLIDYFDKNLAIINTADWKYFRRTRDGNKNWVQSMAEIDAVSDEIKEIIKERGAVSSSDLEFNDTVGWYWNATKLSRAALEALYFRGELVVHHKKGTRKFYDLAENCIPVEILNQPDPFPEDFKHNKWRVLRRIGALGLLWNKPSDAWLNINGLKADVRNEIFDQLLTEKKIIELTIDGLKTAVYCLSADTELLKYVTENRKESERCEFIAPLDNMLWDRKLIKELFDFDYKWEIYTPETQRKYGYYVLPIINGDRFIGRIEIVKDNKTKSLNVKNIWYEDGVKQTKKMNDAIDKCLQRFMRFNECDQVIR